MKKLLLINILCLAGIFAFAQTATLKGKVTDNSTKDPIAFANIVIEQNGIQKGGTQSDKNGFYNIANIAIGTYDVRTTFVGYELKLIKGVVLETGKIKTLDIMMITTPTLLEIVESEVELDEEISFCISPVKSSPYPNRKVKGVAGNCIHPWYPYPVPENNESYAELGENKFIAVSNEPLSTFSVDVDNASYTNIRRFINYGQLPPPEAVRIEEMINYFEYNYPQPKGSDPFSIYSELAECPWNAKRLLFHVGLQGKEIDKSDLPPSSLVFLLDVSGSMSSQNKLPLVKSALRMLVKQLRPEDKVAIVVYAGAAGEVLPSTTGKEKDKILDALDKLNAGGSTAGGEGLKLAYKIANQNLIPKGNNRIILATDGDFNVGVSSNNAMEKLISREREKGISISVLGFGMGNIQDDKMEIIANKGNGNYYYIDNIQEANKVFVKEFGGTLFTIAKDVKFQIEFNPAQVKAYRLIGYENRMLNKEDFNDDKKDAGEIGAGHRVTALYEIIPAHSNENFPDVDDLKYQKSKEAPKTVMGDYFRNELLNLKLRYKKPDAKKSILIEKAVVYNEEIKTSNNFRFSASVAAFGMLLKQSKYINDYDYNEVVHLAKNAKGEDDEGYRAEFVRLVKSVSAMESQAFETKRIE